MLRRGLTESEIGSAFFRIEERGCSYYPQINSFYVRNFQMAYAAEEATRFLHHACRGLPELEAAKKSSELFYVRTVEHALAYFRSRVLYPSREAVYAEGPIEEFEAGGGTAGEKLGDPLYAGEPSGPEKRRGSRKIVFYPLP